MQSNLCLNLIIVSVLYLINVVLFCVSPQQGSSVVKGSPGVLAPGTSTPCRGRRQLPQTPLTPRPAVAYKTANSSPVQPSATSTTGHQSRLSRGFSEHDHLLGGGLNESPMPVTRIGSDPNLNPRPGDGFPQGLLEDTEDFQDAMSTHGGGRSPRTTASSSASASHGAAALPSAMTPQGRGGGVPNGYHFTLGVNTASSSNGRGTGSLREREEEDWC